MSVGETPWTRTPPLAGAAASFFVPGLGSMVSGRAMTGVATTCAWLASLLLTALNAVAGFTLAGGVWLWGIVQGYRDADRWNR